MYRISNKSIIISPKSQRVSSKIKSILPAILITGVGAVLVKMYLSTGEFMNDSATKGVEYIVPITNKSGAVTSVAESHIPPAGTSIFNCALPAISPEQIFMWFVAGAFFGLIVFAILNWKKL